MWLICATESKFTFKDSYQKMDIKTKFENKTHHNEAELSRISVDSSYQTISVLKQSFPF